MSKKTVESATPGAVHPFKRVRRAGVPLSFFETADPAACVQACLKAINGQGEAAPAMGWDCAANTLYGLNEPGKNWVGQNADTVSAFQMGATAGFQALSGKPPVIEIDGDKVGGVVFAHNMQRFLDDPGVLQAVWNCRDTFKACGVSFVLMGPMAKLPVELKNDIPIFSEDVPGEDDINRICDSVFEDAGIKVAEDQRPKIVDGLLGYLSAFAVEQSLCLALRTKAEGGGVDTDQLWRLKVAALKSAAGLDVSLPKSGFESMAGNEGVKTVFGYHLNGREKPRAVLWLDEIEKMTAGSTGGDLSGTSQAVIEQFLQWTAEKRVKGFLLLGVPGAGKSLTAKATAGQAACPLLRASMSSVKGSLVGQSEAQMKAMLASVDAVAQGRVLMVATCNSLDVLSPELMSRFTLGTIFYDYPTAEESAAIWAYYMAKYEIKGKAPLRPNWVGREIESCCERAWLWNISLDQAAETVVPVCTASAAKMDTLRRSAAGRFLSAAHPGLYQVETAQAQPATGRKLNL